jgi:hypothetical protein
MDSTQTIAIRIPPETKEALLDLSREEGISMDEAVCQTLQQFFSLKEFRSLRKRFVGHAEKEGIYSDQDVFDRIS